ncbi:hypothetical protein GOV13_04765 [Candidatus Pacearchaeota archaeon]|nr:hypothetical protein [Candidatus Pacearchaeota archaeon]
MSRKLPDNLTKEVQNKLKNYQKEDIIFTKHAEIQALVRDVDLEDVRKNILNPERLAFATKQESNKFREKYDCYFPYSKHLCHRYIITINRKIIIVTIIKINRDWQKTIG